MVTNATTSSNAHDLCFVLYIEKLWDAAGVSSLWFSHVPVASSQPSAGFEHENSQATPFTRVTVKDISSRLQKKGPMRIIKSVSFHASSASSQSSQSSHARFVKV